MARPSSNGIPGEQTIMPPGMRQGGDPEQDQRELERLRALFADPGDLPKLVGLDGEPITLPEDLFHLLQDTVNALAAGIPVRYDMKRGTMISTSTAADIIGVSRPTMVRFLEEGRLPYTQPGRHRRVKLADVLEFRRRITHEQREAAADVQDLSGQLFED